MTTEISHRRVRIVRGNTKDAALQRFDPPPLSVRPPAGERPRTDPRHVVDYRNVRFAGYLSTFRNITPSDRDGDYVTRGAFQASLASFLTKNPVILMDHNKSCASVAGRWEVLREDSQGLYCEGRISDAPDLCGLRWKIVDGSIRTLSMGGVFHYNSNGSEIVRVELWEGSIVAIPANPDALIKVLPGFEPIYSN